MHQRIAHILDWRRVLVYTHRWLGVAGSILFVGWFVSGVVMMYTRMPRLTPEERLFRAASLDLETARIDPTQAAQALSRPAERLRVGMLGTRPVYRFHDGREWTTIFADTGERLSQLDPTGAVAIAAAFAPVYLRSLQHDGYLTVPDQWTLQIRGLLPAHRVAVGDPEDTYLYVSEQIGEVVLQTTRPTRLWGYLGAVVHWIYFTPIRRNSDVWVQVIIWTSSAGCVLCLFGIAWGFWRFSPSSRFRLRSVHSHTPYASMMRWHHYAGLAFGVVTFTWIFSGLLSMNPGDWSPTTSATPLQRRAVAGGPLAIEQLTLPRLRTAAQILARSFAVKEIELLRFRGDLFAQAYRAPDAAQLEQVGLEDPGAVLASRVQLQHQLISVTTPEQGAFREFDEANLVAAAREAMPDVPIQDLTWLQTYDAYYYDRHAALPLPVLRIRYDDAVNTWLYLNPRRGEIIRKEERLTRVSRWLYHGLHSLDFPWLYQRRPLWDIVVIALSLGGVVLSLSSAPAAWRRLRRHARRARASFRSSSA